MKSKKHRKEKNNGIELEEVISRSNNMDSVDQDLLNGTKKSKKKKKRQREESVDRHNGEHASSLENELITKKKNNKRKLNDSECFEGAEDVSSIVSEPGHKVKKKKKHDSEVSPLATKDICEIDELQTKKKHKKKKRRKPISPPSDAEIEHSQEVPKVKEKKKHKKNNAQENLNDAQIDESNQTGNIKLKGKKNKKKKKTEENDTICRNDNNKIKSSNENPPENSTTLGQWSTASFEDKQRTDKFHRLLGGMKKDVPKKPKGKLFGGLVERSGGNYALDKEGQEQLNKNLQAQYDNALSMRLGSVKGIGFGFTPPPGEGKKFHIDTGKSSSMKFDD